jgi:transcriptional regulator with XRE-family HTH domain
MGNTELAGTEFRKRLRRERVTRKWSQALMAKLLSHKGLAIYATTIAKIESGERAMRVDELVAVAQLFGISLDTLVGHRGDRGNDKESQVTALADTAMRSLWQIGSTESALRAALADLDGFTLDRHDKTLRDGCEAACDAMAEAVAAIRTTHTAMAKIDERQLRNLIGDKAK